MPTYGTEQAPPNMTERLLRLPDVMTMTGLARSTIYQWMEQGRFPRPLKLGLRTVAWRLTEIEAWIDSLPRN